MKILALDCSAGPASAAIFEDGKLIASSYANVKLTHSQTLLPMVENTLASARYAIDDIDLFAVNNGPGSFTGIRIGISAVKGLAAPDNKACVGVSTLFSIACCFKNIDCTLCAVMDARCNQVYNAIFDISNGVITRRTEDRAIMISEVESDLKSTENKPIIIAGDGAELFSEFAKNNSNISIAKEPLRFQNAIGVGIAAEEMASRNETVYADTLLPFYLRLPQAERELKAKKLKGE